MIYDGMKWRKTRKVVTLPSSLWEKEDSGVKYVTFGRVAKDPNDPKAVVTNWYQEVAGGSRIVVKAIPIGVDGHSRTNLMYGKDGYAYLFLKSQVYIRRWKK